ncbi:MAG: 4-(cytidine 5'-diphospho)-2-C-methyl-D-erythritol kinase [Altererythrobacter sp.]|nr:4-(cytidine 5'-diphospho)-2-C-methyl-D-erythritol kinase [Altererythrobacter sp.]
MAERDALTTLGEFASLLPSPWGGVGGGGSAPSTAEHPHPDPPPQGGGGSSAEVSSHGGGGLFDNLVFRTLNALPRADGLAITLEKNLPVAAGLGGGSADAGAVFRIVRDRYGLPDDWRARAAKLGADVPACVESVTAIGRGTGTELEPADASLAGTPVLLVNPRLPLSTGPVFAGWDGVDRGPLPPGDARTIALEGRNDLEAPAIRLCPPIAEVLAALAGTGPWLARMSGSGATCFALYDDEASRDAASAQVHARWPDWWQMKGRLR